MTNLVASKVEAR